MILTFRMPLDDGHAYSVDRYALMNFIVEVVIDGDGMHRYDALYYYRKPWKRVKRHFIGHIVHSIGDTLA